MSANKRVAASLAKIDAALEAGDHYEALQLYSSVARRLSAKRAYSELLPLLAQGAQRLLRVDGNAGGDLLKVFMEKLDASGEVAQQLYPPNELKELLLGFFNAFPDAPSCVLATKNFMERAIACVEERDPDDVGLADDLHLAFAQWLCRHGHERSGMQHFALSGASGPFAQEMRRIAEEVHADEHDLVFCRAVLLCASLGDLRAANELLRACHAQRRDLSYAETPLLRFTAFLLLTLQRRAPDVFSLLKAKYRPSLMRDTEIMQLVNTIGTRYYNIQQGPPGGMQGMLSSLMGGLGAS